MPDIAMREVYLTVTCIAHQSIASNATCPGALASAAVASSGVHTQAVVCTDKREQPEQDGTLCLPSKQ